MNVHTKGTEETVAASPTIRLNAVFYQDGDLWVGHCVELDIVTSHPNRDKVIADTQTLIKTQIIYALVRDPSFEQLFRPASPELAKKLSLGRDEGEIVLVVDGKLAMPRSVIIHKTAA